MTSGTFNRRAFFHYHFTKLENMRILAQNLRIMEYGQYNLQWYHKAGLEYGQCHLQQYHKAGLKYGQYDLQFIRQGYSPSFSNCFLQRGQVALLRKTIIYSKVFSIIAGNLDLWWCWNNEKTDVVTQARRQRVCAAWRGSQPGRSSCRGGGVKLKRTLDWREKKPRRQPRTPFYRWDTQLSPPPPWSPATQVSSKNILLRRVDFGIWLFENQILNSTLRRRMFMINTTTYFH